MILLMHWVTGKGPIPSVPKTDPFLLMKRTDHVFKLLRTNFFFSCESAEKDKTEGTV
jgi:hypothetical protein